MVKVDQIVRHQFNGGRTVFYKDESLALFIDGTNLYAAAKANGFEIDYKLLRQEFMRRGKLLRAFYYTIIQEYPDGHDPVRPLIDWLDYNGYAVVAKPAREYTDSLTNRKKVKGNISVELTVDALELSKRMNHAVLFTGDGDFIPLVESLKRNGVRVSIVSTKTSAISLVSDDLRRAADNFIELGELRGVIGKPPPKREETAAETAMANT
jgi:uncharacterized LabA/DUF88 family protein